MVGLKKSQAAAPEDEARLFAYTVPRDRIRAFASVDLDNGEALTVLSSKPLRGLRTRRLKRIKLAGGGQALALDVGGVQAAAPEPAVPDAAFAPDARARAILRGVEYAHGDLKDAGGSYDLAQVRRLMRGVSRQAVDKRVKEGSLLAVPGPSNRRAYPTFQFNRDGSVVAGLKAVLDALPTHNPWAVLNFLVNPQDALGGVRPIDRLRAGATDEVVAAARRVGEQGA